VVVIGLGRVEGGGSACVLAATGDDAYSCCLLGVDREKKLATRLPGVWVLVGNGCDFDCDSSDCM